MAGDGSGAVVLIDGTAGASLPIKPRHGSPCNGCGWCCAVEPCNVARKYTPTILRKGCASPLIGR